MLFKPLFLFISLYITIILSIIQKDLFNMLQASIRLYNAESCLIGIQCHMIMGSVAYCTSTTCGFSMTLPGATIHARCHYYHARPLLCWRRCHRIAPRRTSVPKGLSPVPVPGVRRRVCCCIVAKRALLATTRSDHILQFTYISNLLYLSIITVKWRICFDKYI